MNVDSYRRRAAADRATPKLDAAATATTDNLNGSLADNIKEDVTA